MSELTPDKIAKLTALMAAAPPEAAARLFDLFERLNVKGSEIIPSEVLINALRDSGKVKVLQTQKPKGRLPTFQRLFFEPFESLFENGSLEQLAPGAIQRAGLKEAWQLIVRHFAPDDFVDVQAKATQAILIGDLDYARALVQQIHSGVLAKLTGLNTADIASLAKSRGTQDILTRLAPLLLAVARGRDLWAMAQDRKGVLNPTGVEGLCAKLLVLDVMDRDAARELALLTMSILPAPCEALKVLNRAFAGVKDRKIDEADFSIVCQRAIRSAQDAAASIQSAIDDDTLSGRARVKAQERGVQILNGLEQEAQLKPDSALCGALLAICGKAGGGLEALCQDAVQSLHEALPVGIIQSYSQSKTHKPRFDVALDPQRLKLAVQALSFIAESRVFKPLGGFSAARDQADKSITTYLNEVREELMRVSRLPTRHNNFQTWVSTVADMIRAFQGFNAAEAFEGRMNVRAA